MPAGTLNRGRRRGRPPAVFQESCQMQKLESRGDHLQGAELSASQQLHPFPLFQVIDHLCVTYFTLGPWRRICTSRGLSPLSVKARSWRVGLSAIAVICAPLFTIGTCTVHTNVGEYQKTLSQTRSCCPPFPEFSTLTRTTPHPAG